MTPVSMYYYKDMVNGKIKGTRGKFTGWTERGGLLNARYAIFQNRRGAVLVPEYALTPESKKRVRDAEVTQANRHP